MFPGKFSILRNLNWGLIFTVTLVLSLFNLFFYLRSINQIESNLQSQASDTADRLSGVLGTPMWNFDTATIQQIASVYSNLDEVAALVIRDYRGTVIYDYQKDGAAIGAITRIADVQHDDEIIGSVSVAISKNSIRQEQRNSLLSAVLSTMIIVLAIVATNQFLLSRFLNRPMRELTHGLEQIAQGNYQHRLTLFNLVDMDSIARSINLMADQISSRDQQLRELIDTLEDRVAARTRDLRIAADVSRRISRVLELESLLSQLVEHSQAAFGLYHIAVFLYEPTTQTLHLKAASGEVGQHMKEQETIFLVSDEPGVVRKAAKTLDTIVVNDVHTSGDHLVNLLLPHTSSEIALPMIIGGSLVGVLDMQARETNRFQREDIEVFKSLADQIAIAVRNANLYQAATVAQAEAERASAVKSQFLASMSHELRTPLNGIINFTGFVVDGMLGPVNEKQNKFLKDAITNAEHLLSLINDVLDISKIESGSLKLFVEEDVDLAGELEAVIRIGEALLQQKPVKIIKDVPGDLPRIRGDKRRIRQIILNIISNACKFTDEGMITVQASLQDHEIRLSIKDTGPGIAPEDHSKVFEIFLQTESGLRKGGGTGLGMPISRRLAEAHGGKLWLESEVGQGATFFLTLPIKNENLEPVAVL